MAVVYQNGQMQCHIQAVPFEASFLLQQGLEHYQAHPVWLKGFAVSRNRFPVVLGKDFFMAVFIFVAVFINMFMSMTADRY